MNILYLAHRIPYPPDKGDKIRSFHQIRHLSKKHRVHLVCMVDDSEDVKYIPKLQRICESVYGVYQSKVTMNCKSLLAVVTGDPLSVRSFYSVEFQRRVNVLLSSEPIDLIFLYSSAMAQYVKKERSIPKMMDFVDVDSEKWSLYVKFHQFPLSWVYQLEAQRLAKYEEEVANSCDCSLFVTNNEAEKLRERVKGRPISVITNGVDLDFFQTSGKPTPQESPPRLIFVGAMDYFPNIDAVNFFSTEIFPIVRESIPDIRFTIVGRNPSSKVKLLETIPGITVAGGVKDIRPFLEQAWVSLAPLRIARGIQNKILEAMAMGLPIVGTSQAFEGMNLSSDDGIRVANSPEEMAGEILQLLNNSQLRMACSRQVRRYVERCHRWDVLGSELESLLVHIARNPNN